MRILLFSIIILGSSVLNNSEEISDDSPTFENESPKLLIILLDGFRWDYYDRQKQQLQGFRKILSEGIQAEYVEPIFPTLSFPSWTTLATGLYPNSHNIVGNYMLYLGDDEIPETIFQLKDNSTKSTWWWKNAESLWVTATKSGIKSFLGNFAYCDVPFEGIIPTECTGYSYQDVNVKFREHLNKAVTRFRQGYSLAMIYDDSIDHAGHLWGPDSNELRLSVIAVDKLMQELLLNIKVQGLQDKVNVVITSDHGMTSIKKQSGVQFLKLGDYIQKPDEIYKVIDYGAVVSICTLPGKTDSVYQQLLTMPGVNVYKKEDIPEEFHYKESLLVHDILILAREGYFIVGLPNEKQIPFDKKSSSVQPYAGCHGYYNSTDMRTIFFANGPAFKSGILYPPIRLEDEYQIFTHILDIKPRANNGSWERVSDMFATAKDPIVQLHN